MKSQKWMIRLVGAAAALALGTTLAVAQNNQYGNNGDHSQNYHEHGDHASPAERQGWAAGQAQGRSDRQHGHSFRPTKVDTYKNVPHSPKGYKRDQFKNEYREAFVKGYSQGYGRH